MTDSNVNLGAVMERLHESGFQAAVENTGGGVMCLAVSSAGSEKWSAMVGPGWTEEGLILADTRDLYVTPYDHSPDDDPDGDQVTTVALGTDVAGIVALAQAEANRTEVVRMAAILLVHGVDADRILSILEHAA